MRYFLQLTYKGTDFHGWQKQPNAITVQGEIEYALSKLLNKETEVVGCGRTDTGVHAHQYFAHFDNDNKIDVEALMFKLNSFLGQHIAIQDIYPVHADAHARFDATSRTYRYFISYQKEVFDYEKSWYLYHSNLDLGKMNEAAAYLLNVSDFSAFEKTGSDNKTSICKVSYARWSQFENSLFFEIRADRFLRNMVRSIVGTLVDVGRGKIDFDQFQNIVASGERKLAGTSVPAHGLFLWEITYPITHKQASS